MYLTISVIMIILIVHYLCTVSASTDNDILLEGFVINYKTTSDLSDTEKTSFVVYKDAHINYCFENGKTCNLI